MLTFQPQLPTEPSTYGKALSPVWEYRSPRLLASEALRALLDATFVIDARRGIMRIVSSDTLWRFLKLWRPASLVSRASGALVSPSSRSAWSRRAGRLPPRASPAGLPGPSRREGILAPAGCQLHCMTRKSGRGHAASPEPGRRAASTSASARSGSATLVGPSAPRSFPPMVGRGLVSTCESPMGSLRALAMIGDCSGQVAPHHDVARAL